MSYNKNLPHSPYWNVNQAASFLGISADHLYKLVRAKKVPFSKPPTGSLYFEESILRAFIEEYRVEPNIISKKSMRKQWQENFKN